MRLYIQQKVFTIGDKFDVWDEMGNAKYYVKGEIFSFGKKLHVFDQTGQEVAYITQKLMKMMPTYELYLRGQLAATVRKKVSFFSHKFDILGTDLRVEGDAFAHSFRLVDGNGQTQMILGKKYLSWGDSYEMEIFNPVLELICLGVNLCIDAALHDD